MNLTALFGAVAGFSERLVPSLIKQIEEHISVRDLLTEPVQVKEVQNEPVQKKKQPRLGRHK
jgi:hypothetical protein